MFRQRHVLPPIRQEVSDPPVGGVRHIQLGEPVLQQSQDDSIEGMDEVHKENLEDEVKNHDDSRSLSVGQHKMLK